MKTTIAIGLALAAARVWIGMNFEVEAFSWLQAYKDAAHMFVAGLAVSWWYRPEKWKMSLFWFLCVVEVVVAVWSRIG